MNKLYLFLFLFLLSCQNDASQNGNSGSESSNSKYQDPFHSPTNAFVKKYQGSIGNNEKAELILINLENGMLEGFLSYKNTPNSKRIEIEGELSLDEKFILETFEEDLYQGKFVGSLTELSELNGIWYNSDSTISKPFSFVEIPFEDNTGWTGSWYRNVEGSPGLLVIGNVSKNKFDFGMEIFSSGHNGILKGTATINKRIATFDDHVFDETEKCNIIFQKKDNHIVVMQKTSTVACGLGMRAIADGKYEDEIKNINIE